MKDQVPKNHKDLLDPKWKGKMPITSSGVDKKFVGNLYEQYGLDFVKKPAKQDFAIHSISTRALLDLIVSGEYAFSPALMDGHAAKSKPWAHRSTGSPCNPFRSFVPVWYCRNTP
ncbi:hypothetical protein ACFL0M_12965 [Thermodesulfobacteriota bacterium]